MRNINTRNSFVTLAALALTVIASAQEMRSPLNPSDPKAQLPAELQNYQPLPQPKYAESNAAASQRVRLEFKDLDNGQMGQSGLLPGTSAATPRLGMAFKGKAIANPAGSKLDQMVRPLYVIGADNRTKVTNTAAYPWRAQCKLYITFPDGSNWIGSGTMIQSRFVLTAGHCVWDGARGGWASRIQVVPGLNGSYMPYGSAFASRLASNTGWTRDANRDHDMAVIKLDRTIGNTTGWLGYGSFSDGTLNGNGLHLSAYDGDRDGGTSQLYRNGYPDSLSSKRIEYKMDTSGGSSGGGLYVLLNNNRYCAGVNAYQSKWWFFGWNYVNGGTRLDNTKVGWINNWLNGGL